MQELEVLNRIRDKFASMSPSQRRVADAILKDPEAAAFFNVAELARQADVSDSTVTRFAAFLGYNGFPDLSERLQAIVRMRLTTKERFERSQSQHEPQNSVFSSSIMEDMQRLQLLLDQLDDDKLGQSVRLLTDADQIGVVCARSSVALGMYLEFYLSMFDKRPLLLTGEPRTADWIQRLRPSDVVVGIGFSRYTRYTVESLKYLRSANVPILAITDYPSSPLAACATLSFYCPTGIASHLDSFVAPMALLQAILHGMAHASYPQAVDKLRELERTWAAFDTYYVPED